MQVAVGLMRGDWDGLRPRLTLQDFRLSDRHGRVALAFERAELTLSWWALASGEVRFADVDFWRPELTLRRGADGIVYLGDKALNAESQDDDGTFTRWLLAQPGLGVHDAVLTWRDERGGQEVRLEQVEIAVERHHGGHRAALTALPRGGIARRIDLRVEAHVRRDGERFRADGEFFGELLQADLERLKAHLPLPEALRSGVGSLRMWASFDTQRPTDVVADLSLRDARAQLAADAPALELATLAGRIRYRALPGGFSVDAEGLGLRLASDAKVGAAGNFHISRADAPNALLRTEVRADAVDLTLVAALLEYLPVPHELKARVASFSPHGRLANARVTWTGDAVRPAHAYTLDGRFEGINLHAADGFPGVAGLTGEISGTELGGVVRIASKDMQLNLTRYYDEPLRFDSMQARAKWRHGDRPLEVTVEEARFANADVDGEFSGTWRAQPEAKHASPGFADFRGSLSRATAAAAARYVPIKMQGTRDWLIRSIESGSSPRVTFLLQGDLYEFPFGPGHAGRFVVEGDLRDGRLRYHPDWPSVDDVNGTFRFENRRMEIRASRASIFASRATQVSAVIEDLRGAPPLVVIEGEIATSGADSMRFLRESPLVKGPGAFTRAVAVEGPGKLRLRLDYPLSGVQPVRVNGEYTFEGATATAGERLAMRDVRGQLAFTERGVRAGITGSLFGKPVTLAMATADNTVVTTLEGRVDAAYLAEHIAEPLAARLSGELAWQARVTSGAQGVDLTVTSDLAGLASTLPAPLGKAAAEPRAFTLAIAKLGTEAELTTASLAGGVHGRFGRMRDTQRWHAALRFGSPVGDQPVREGLWLTGTVPAADADAWLAVFAPARGAAPVPEAPGAEGFGLRGIDLALGRVRYMGRDFTSMRARLERNAGRWAGNLESPLVAGVVQWDPAGRGRVMARLSRLSISPSAEAPGASSALTPAGGAESLPELDISAEHFDFRGKWLGRLDLEAKPAGEEWKIARLDITSAHARFKSSGAWRNTGAGALTSLDVKLEADNLNSLLGQFGYGDYVRGGSGGLEGRLVWPGAPQDFATHLLSGTFKLEARRGQFSKIEPGAGKLLSLLSLQSLPRRATLDFGDVFSEGFAFERMEGEVKLARGILLVENFEISGPSAFVSLSGEVSLPAETQALTLRVVPEVGESIALAATLVGTPVLGLSTLLVSKLLKNPVGKVVAFEYQVTGSWDNPQVTRTSAPAPRAAAASAPESPSAPRAATP